MCRPRYNWPLHNSTTFGLPPAHRPIDHFGHFVQSIDANCGLGYYATCRLIDNDVNKMDAMVAIGPKTTITAVAAAVGAETKAQTETKWAESNNQRDDNRNALAEAQKKSQTHWHTHIHSQRKLFSSRRPLDIKNMHMSKTIWRPIRLCEWSNRK